MSVFNIADWYWIVGGDQTQVYASGRGTFVPTSDATYLAWRALDNAPSAIESIASLGQVLVQSSVRPTDAGVLDSYLTEMAGGVVKSAIFKIEFNHENRLRTIERALSLNGSPANLTQQQALAAVKALL